MDQGPTRRRIWFGLLALFFAVCLFARDAVAQEQRRFLFLYAQNGALAANVAATRGVTETLDRALGADYEIYAEYRDDQRFPGPEADATFAAEIAVKYRGQRFDAILAFGASALAFALAHRSELAEPPPIVFGGIGDAVLAGFDLPSDVHGVRSAASVAGTLALAERLQPEARRAVVVTGSSAFDRTWEATARSALAGADLPVDYLSGLTLQGFADVAAGLGPDAILVVLTVYEDAAGQKFAPGNAAAIIAAASAVPTYGVYDTFIGRGVVGGEVQRFEDVGVAMAEQALDLIAGKTTAAMREAPVRAVVDWLAMQRFQLDRALLPPGTLVENYQPSAWERYRLAILLAAAVIVAQSATIAALAAQGRRRQKAEREVAAGRVELAHMSRVAQLGELSGALAHELNQPLTAILANAEAGVELARRDPPDLEEIAAILADIAEDDRRAAGIIVELRRLMTKGEKVPATLDLNAVAEATALLCRSECLMRQVAIDLRLAREPLTVRANEPQLKQVVLNLLLNAADAMADQPGPIRVVTVATRTRADGWRELTVADHGPGLAPEVAGDPFRPFVTTKPHGLGLGLSICRTIVQSHGGVLHFDPDQTEGATAILALPPP